MTKHGKDYRGEDRTLEMIRERATSTLPEDIEPTDVENWQECWDATCIQLAREMCSEGLINTAREILSHHSKNEKDIVIGVTENGCLVGLPKDIEINH